MISLRIFRLPDEIVLKIAAGEVITNISSVVKELVENSLDAGSSRIEVILKNGGKESIVVKDDGEGMTEEDILLAIEPHTTSKLRSLEDLLHLKTFGFRGEALSSIVRVSRTRIVSKTEMEDVGTEVEIIGGKVISTRKVGVGRGTFVEVRDIFFNFPVRRRRLKSPKIEARMATERFQKYLLSNPKVHFILNVDGKIIYNCPPVEDIHERIPIIFPELSDRNIMYIEKDMENMSLKGYITFPEITRPNRTGEVFFVNGRNIISDLLHEAVMEAYEELLKKRRYPIVVLFLKVPGNEIDINVHPQKLEVKFLKEEIIRNFVRNAIKEVLSKEWYRKIVFVSDSYKIKEKVHEVKESFPTRLFHILKGRYAIFEETNGIVIMDFHAAHERLLYEDIIEFMKKEKRRRKLRKPLKIPLSSDEILLVEEKGKDLKSIGFDWETLTDGINITAFPPFIPATDLTNVFKDLVEDLKVRRSSKLMETVARISCKYAIKSGMNVGFEEIIAMYENLKKKGTNVCPHGRPIYYLITYDELDRFFERK
ncbi:MAG: DNA mismatch repair endonuclease MutL [Thermotogae bacterium]|nr:MAG: DNA mismatch repair endonuclease MutL [Thermotogota bacterium]